jgi:tetratricopeptide (TPR) repeat protein
MRFIFLCFFIITCSTVGYTQTPEDVLATAKNSYDKKDYSSTISSYKSLVENGYRSEDLYFNLATAYFQNSELAESVLYYEKTLKLNSYNKEASNNLSIVNDQRASELSMIPDFFLNTWWRNFSGFLSSGWWSILGFLLLLASIWLFYGKLMQGKGSRSMALSILLFIVAFVFFLAARTSYKMSNELSHLVNLKEKKLYTTRDDTSTVLNEIIPGEKIRIVDRVGEWYEVMLINKERGWMTKQDLEEI